MIVMNNSCCLADAQGRSAWLVNLSACRLYAHGTSLYGTFRLGLPRLGLGLSGLGIGDRLDGIGLFAFLCLGLLELAFGSERIVAGNGSDDLLRLALDRVDQTFTCLVGLLVRGHSVSFTRNPSRNTV